MLPTITKNTGSTSGTGDDEQLLSATGMSSGTDDTLNPSPTPILSENVGRTDTSKPLYEYQIGLVKSEPDSINTGSVDIADTLMPEINARIQTLTHMRDEFDIPLNSTDPESQYAREFKKLQKVLQKLPAQTWLKDDAALIKKINTVLSRGSFLLDCVAEEQRTRNLCRVIMEHHPPSVEVIPAHFRTPRFFLEALGAANNKCNVIFALYHDYVPMDYLVRMYTFSSYCPTEESVRSWLLNMIDKQNTDFFSPLPELSALGQVKPGASEPSTTRPALKNSLQLCLDFSMPDQDLAGQLKAFLQQHTLEKADPGKLPTLDSLPELSAFYGNRSFASPLPDDRIACLKFQIKDEDWGRFIAEDAMHHFCQNNQQTLKLESDIPQPIGLFKIPCDTVPHSVCYGLKEPLARYSLDGKDYYVVYQFATSKDYICYCNSAKSPDEIGRAENGLLKAASDLGRWCSLGVLYSEPLKMWHNFYKSSYKNRESWSLFPCIKESDVLPGPILKWREGIDKSDFGYSGLRDLGDFSLYGGKPLNAGESNSTMSARGFRNKVEVIETIGRSLLGIMLVYQDLHLKHSRQPAEAAIKEAGEFFDRVCSSIFNAFPDGLAVFETCKLDEQYQKWKTSAMQELYYQTKRSDHLRLNKLSNGMLFLCDIAVRTMSEHTFRMYSEDQQVEQ